MTTAIPTIDEERGATPPESRRPLPDAEPWRSFLRHDVELARRLGRVLPADVEYYQL